MYHHVKLFSVMNEAMIHTQVMPIRLLSVVKAERGMLILKKKEISMWRDINTSHTKTMQSICCWLPKM